MDEGLTIQDVAALTGLTTYTLRYYEKEGLLPLVERQMGGHRRYMRRQIDAIVFITRLRTTGMPIRRIRDYVNLAGEDESAVGQRKAILEAHRIQVSEQIVELERCRELIDHKLELFENGRACAPEGETSETGLKEIGK